NHRRPRGLSALRGVPGVQLGLQGRRAGISLPISPVTPDAGAPGPSGAADDDRGRAQSADLSEGRTASAGQDHLRKDRLLIKQNLHPLTRIAIRISVTYGILLRLPG